MDGNKHTHTQTGNNLACWLVLNLACEFPFLHSEIEFHLMQIVYLSSQYIVLVVKHLDDTQTYFQ